MNKILLFAAALVALLYSCEKDTYERISREDWTKLQVGDTLLFNGANRVDTFVVDNINNYYETSDKIYHREYLEVNYKKIDSNVGVDSLFQIYRTRRNFNGTSIVWQKLDNICMRDTVLQIGNNSYTNVYYLDNTLSTNANYIKRIYYSNLFGIIRYEYFNGLIYTLDSDCLKTLTERTIN